VAARPLGKPRALFARLRPGSGPHPLVIAGAVAATAALAIGAGLLVRRRDAQSASG